MVGEELVLRVQEAPTLWFTIDPELRCTSKHAIQQNMKDN